MLSECIGFDTVKIRVVGHFPDAEEHDDSSIVQSVLNYVARISAVLVFLNVIQTKKISL